MLFPRADIERELTVIRFLKGCIFVFGRYTKHENRKISEQLLSTKQTKNQNQKVGNFLKLTRMRVRTRNCQLFARSTTKTSPGQHRRISVGRLATTAFPSFERGPSAFQKDKLAAPRMFLTFKKPHKWQLRAYMYQARDILAGDQSGLSDPYARVVFLNQSQVTEKIMKTLCPTWDQTLIFTRVEIHSDPQSIARKPPTIVVETFDHDQFGEDEFLGRCEITPIVKLNAKDPRRPVLQWHEIQKNGRDAGELLAAFELYLVDDQQLPPPPPRRQLGFMVPEGVRPVMQRTGIEILSWGVRNMRKYQLMNVTSPSVEFEIGGHIVSTDIIKNTKRNPNFDKPLIFLDVMLPKEELYMPPMNMRVRDHRQFGRKPMVGLYVLKTMDKFRYAPLTEDHDPLADIPTLSDGNIGAQETVIEIPPEEPSSRKKKIDLNALDEDIDWWSKYYASLGELNKCRKYKEMGYDTIAVHKNELEKMENHGQFSDFCSSFHLVRGKNVDDDDDEDNTVGEFKGTFRVYPLPEDRSIPMPDKYLEKGIPDPAPVECTVRVYIIKAIDLQPNDPSGLADPYVEVKLGKKEVDNKDAYVPNSLCPVFGRMFELKCTIPIYKDLEIRIKDYDLLGTDDIIGETYIDLENRLLSKFRGTVGIPQTYCVSGPNQWRDALKPKEILEWFCEKNHLPPPEYDGNTSVRVGRRTFSLSTFERNKLTNPHLGPAEERLALHVLNCLPIVKEHVETRPLYSPLQPGIEQGKLQMWVDIYPNHLGVPGPAVDIRPREPRKYQLRIIIWNTKDVILEEESITGEKMSDIYVKGWIAGIDDKQETDVHYRSLDGEGNFNWRFVFPFEYLPAENSMVVKKKEHFWSLDETEQRLPPNLVVQVWDNDKFSADDFLGTLELNLAHMPAPVKKSRLCNLEQLPAFGGSPKMINLFECHRAYGYWPCFNDETGTAELTGKVEMELELIPEADAETKPAGLGRDEPNENPHLDPPKRPDTSFFWFTSPWKTFKFIVWKQFKYYFIGGICIILAALLIVLFVYAIPGLTAKKMMGV